ncbi:tail fiber domain-containing protein [Aureitalea sp. L0-47]|uniref:tail fiber domain-containing protein n=1 Tax=Aureitalea sp. L0-47 TaxID=2816962 RepID=UPI002237B3A1|nr:tail fiber domain-containing protein [Aureitalea sp. L0-47]MCW5518631.1 tail fiber domain-containing protein [Aureitalea sp. L0-47]
MKRLCYFLLMISTPLFSQVGIGTITPNASLEIQSTNQATPASTDGLLIPKVDEFPVTNPGASQDGMLVYATGTGSVSKGFYYWDNGTTAWVLATGAKNINDLSDGITDVSGSSIFLGTDAGINDDGTVNGNVGIGRRSLRDNTTGGGNTAIGNSVMRENITGDFNSAFGYSALISNTSGSYNTSMGYSALQSNSGGINNVALGARSLRIMTNGGSNTAIGHNSMPNSLNGSGNIALGSYSGNNVEGDANILIGNNAGDASVLRTISNSIFIGNNSGTNETNSDKLYIENSSADANNALIYGEFDNDILRTNGTLQIGNPASGGFAFPISDGTANQVLQTDGAGAMTWVDSSASGAERIDDLSDGLTDATGSSIFLGIGAGANDDGTANRNTGIGFNVLNTNVDGFSNIAFGHRSLFSNATGNYNLAIGADALYNTTGDRNVGVGHQTMLSNTTGNFNVALGANAGHYVQGDNNVFIGRSAGYVGSTHSKDGSVFIGNQAGYSESNSNRLYIENSNSTSPLIYGEFDNDILRTNGTLQIGNPTSGGYAFPTGVGTANEVLQTDGSGGTSWVAPSTLVTHRINDLVDGRSDNDGTDDGSSIFLGIDAGTADDETNNLNVGIGYRALFSNTSGEYNVATGALALYNNTTGNRNTASGYNALASNTFGIENTAIGNDSLLANDQGNGNTAIGNEALFTNLDGELNTASGSHSLHQNLTGDNNAAFGAYSMYDTNGNNNTAVGISSGRFVSGDNNVFLGYQAGRGAAAIVKNGSIHIGYQAGYNELNNNRLYIENSSSSTPLIYGEFDNDILGLNANVGIGTQAPGAPLHVTEDGTSNVQTIVAGIVSDVSNRPVLQFSETATIGLNEGMSLEYNGTGSGSANRMVINGVGGNPLFEFRNGGSLTLTNGDLIIEGTATDREIRMMDDAGNPDRTLMRQTGTQDIYVGDIDNNGGDTYIRAGGNTELSIISGTGFVGVNTLTPGWELEVNGNAAKPGGGSWINSSDRRLKQNINTYQDGLQLLLQIEPVTFNYNTLSGFDTSKEHVGVIAQELQKVVPYMVQNYQSDKGEFLSVDNSAMTYMLINAVKEQQLEIDTLKQELEELKNLIKTTLNE